VENTGFDDGSAGGYQASQQHVGFLRLTLGAKPFGHLLSASSFKLIMSSASGRAIGSTYLMLNSAFSRSPAK
jgi:hypothetical protein